MLLINLTRHQFFCQERSRIYFTILYKTLSGFCPGRFVCVFVSCIYVCVVLQHMALSLFVLAMCSSVPASLFPSTTPSCLVKSSFVWVFSPVPHVLCSLVESSFTWVCSPAPCVHLFLVWVCSPVPLVLSSLYMCALSLMCCQFVRCCATVYFCAT